MRRHEATPPDETPAHLIDNRRGTRGIEFDHDASAALVEELVTEGAFPTATPLAIRGDRLALVAIDTLFYCAESVLQPEYRGRGLGHEFFRHRERFAREHGFTHACFCAVVRPEDHPARPEDYRPLDGFWQKRGYRRQEGVTTRFAWQDRGDTEETEKTMQFWLRDLRETPPADADA